MPYAPDVTVWRQDVARHLRALREAHGWSQRHLAELAGVSPDSIVSLEKGRNVSLDTLDAVAGALTEDVDTALRQALTPAAPPDVSPVRGEGESMPESPRGLLQRFVSGLSQDEAEVARLVLADWLVEFRSYRGGHGQSRKREPG